MNALLALAVLALLLTLIYGPWQAACTDWARERLFAARDAIFDMAAAGELDFQSSAYRDIRQSLESQIRYAHMLSLPRFLFMVVFAPSSGGSKRYPSSESLLQIKDEDVRKRIHRQVESAQSAITLMLVMKSPVAMLTVLTILPFLVLAKAIGRDWTNSIVADLQKKAAERVEAEAVQDDFAHARAA